MAVYVDNADAGYNITWQLKESNLNPSKKQIRFINVVVDLQDRLGTGEISVVTFNNEYSLRFTANLMLVNASAGFNIELAVI